MPFPKHYVSFLVKGTDKMKKRTKKRVIHKAKALLIFALSISALAIGSKEVGESCARETGVPPVPVFGFSREEEGIALTVMGRMFFIEM